MSKYLRSGEKEQSRSWFSILGIITVFFYLATSFPGNPFFSDRFNQLFLYAFIAESIAAIVYNLKEGWRMSLHFWWYGIFTAISLMTLLFFREGRESDDFKTLVTTFLLVTAISVFINNQEYFKALCWAYVIISFVNTIAMLAMGRLFLQNGERLGESFEVNPNVLATFLMYAVIYGFWLFCYETEVKKKIVLIIAILMIAYALSLTGGRKFTLAPIMFLIILLMMKNREMMHKKTFRTILTIFVVLILAYFLMMNIPALYNALGIRIEQMLNAVTGKGETDMSTELRSQLRSLAIQGWLESPIWGHGFDSFKYLSARNGLGFFYSHSNITELLYNGGILQFISYYWFYIMLFFMSLKRSQITEKYRSFCIAAVAVQAFYDYGGVSYHGLHNQLFILMAFIGLGLTDGTDSISMYPDGRKYKYVL